MKYALGKEEELICLKIRNMILIYKCKTSVAAK